MLNSAELQISTLAEKRKWKQMKEKLVQIQKVTDNNSFLKSM